jgi:hypothetical protein
MGKLFTVGVGNLLTVLLGNVLTAGMGKVLDIYISAALGARPALEPATAGACWRRRKGNQNGRWWSWGDNCKCQVLFPSP